METYKYYFNLSWSLRKYAEVECYQKKIKLELVERYEFLEFVSLNLTCWLLFCIICGKHSLETN
jgi:hypothetical protein